MSRTCLPLEGALPDIVIGDETYNVLWDMQDRLPPRLGHVAGLLAQELGRAEVVPEAAVPSERVRLNTLLRLQFGGSEEITPFRLVYPEEADFSAGRLSVLSLAGAALAGLRPGTPMFWTSLTGTPCSLMVHEILEH